MKRRLTLIIKKRKTTMNRLIAAVVAGGLSLLPVVPAMAQSTPAPNPAMTTPDQVAWQFFIQVNTRAGGSGNNATFETWASDTDTFQVNPQFPATAAPLALREPAVPNLGRVAAQRAGQLLPAVPPGIGVTEESRRNKEAFDFIVQNNLYKVSGLIAAFGKTISFPAGAMEVKANWMPVSAIPAFTQGRVALGDVPKLYHVNTGADGKPYAFVAMHIISKAVPNWTWATFEHQLNPSRCDIIGCRDSFGAQTPVVQPNANQNRGYPACAKTPALTAMINAANWDPAFANYCLKGSQTDFTDATGLDVRLGNSVTENGFVQQSSCITCHGRAAWDKTGNMTTGGGFDQNGNAPLGPIQPNWYWTFNTQPPIFQGMPGLTQIATSADFIWSIPFCAIDDTQTPPAASNCAGK
jgi:hypothetical protein